MNSNFLIVVGLLVAGVSLVGCQVNLGLDSSSVDSTPRAASIIASDPTELEPLAEYPPEFAAMTVPGLRQQTYPGSQIEIVSEYYQRPTYTAYRAQFESAGLTQYGLLTVPVGAESSSDQYPAVVFVHGYIPPDQYQTNQRYQAYVDGLAESGLVVFKIDLRGHDQSEGEPSGAYFSAGYVEDVLNAAASLRQLPYVDEAKVGAWGHSMAGNVVFRAVAVDQELSAAVIWAGAVFTYADFEEYRIQDSSFVRTRDTSERILNRSEQLRTAVGQYSADSPFWQAMTPVNYLDSMSTPIQLHHAANDSVVTVEYSQNLAEILAAANYPHQFYQYQTGGHDIESPSFSTALQRTVDFFQNPDQVGSPE